MTQTSIRIRPHRDPGVEWVVGGELLVPDGGATTVQVLLPGLTYDRRYWRVPGDNDYAELMVQAGYAVLALDRLGTGQSSRPPAHRVTVDRHVEVIHHVIQELRRGTPTGSSFDRVVLVGHGFGAGLAIVEAARHADVDTLVLTGLLSTTAPAYQELVGHLHPAAQDPLLGDPDLPEGYLTQPPGVRARVFEHAAGIDRYLSAHDELIKSTVTTGEVESLAQIFRPEYSAAVQCPVLRMVGEHDILARGRDSGTRVIAATGHSLNLHRGAAEGYRLIREWLDRHLVL